jgi:predicted transcriptional regulator
MTLKKIAENLQLSALTPEVALDDSVDVRAAHASDLLSDVLANAPGGGLLLTIQVHLNVIAVALHAGLCGVIFTSGMEPDEAVRAKAREEGLPLLGTAEQTFDVAGKLYALGLRGRHG